MDPAPKPPFRFWWLWLLIFLAIFFSVKPVYRGFKWWRSEMFLKRSEQAYNAGNVYSAREQAFLCLQLNPQNVEANRILGRIADQQNEIDSVGYWMNVVNLGNGVQADRIALAEAALRENVIPIAERQLAFLISRQDPSPEVYNLAGLLAVSQKKSSVAREWFLQAIARDPGYVRAKINLARVDVFLSSDSKRMKEGVDLLQKLGDLPTREGLDSLRTIAEFGKSSPGKMPYNTRIAAKIKAHPLKKIQDICLLADWEIATDPTTKKALVQAMASYLNHASSGVKKEIASWFNRNKMYALTLKYLPLDASNPEDLLLMQVDAMAYLGKWKELSDFLSQDLPELNPMLLAVYRARVAKEIGDGKTYELYWKQAMNLAGNQPHLLRYLADYSEKINDLDRIIEVNEALCGIPAHAEEALIRLVRLYERKGDTQSVYNTVRRLGIIRPDDLVIVNDQAYLGLLLNDASVRPYDKARQVYSANASVPAFAITYALSQMKSGYYGQALEVLKPFKLEALTAPGWRAVYAAVLDHGGRTADAIRVARTIQIQYLKKEELDLISSLLKTAGGSRGR